MLTLTGDTGSKPLQIEQDVMIKLDLQGLSVARREEMA
jgi:hypothetical protein